MKKVFFTLGFIFLVNSNNCFLQPVEKTRKEFKSKTNHVIGISNDFNDALFMGITFEKAISSTDTTYYIEFQLDAPSSEYRTDICLNRESAITFIAKSGRFVDLKLTNVNYLIKSDKQTFDPFSPIKLNYHSTTLMLEVTKEELIKIGSEPFYKIILPYFNFSSKVYNKIEFIKPALFTRRIFIQKNIKYIFAI